MSRHEELWLFHEADTAPVPGLRYLPSWTTKADVAALLGEIDGQPWQTVLQRRTQQYGAWEYAYMPAQLKAAEHARALPPLLQETADKVSALLGATRIDHVLVNEYEPGQGIAPHIDHEGFGAVASLSIGSQCFFDLYRKSRGDIARSLWLRSGDMVVLEGEARSDWKHGIRARKSDDVAGMRVKRERRVSVTFRTVLEAGD